MADTETDTDPMDSPLRSAQQLERYVWADVLISLSDSQYLPDDADPEALDADPAQLYRAAALTLGHEKGGLDPHNVDMAVTALMDDYRAKRNAAMAERGLLDADDDLATDMDTDADDAGGDR